MSLLLDVDRLTVTLPTAQGRLAALRGVSFTLERAGTLGLVGESGCGKSLTALALMGLLADGAQVSGSIRFDGRELTGLADHRIADLGIARTFQNLELFADLSVLDNVRIARHRFQRASLVEVLWNLARKRREDAREREKAESIIESVGLADKLHARVRDLPYGTQKLVELARAIALEPKLMLLDEPAAGMNNREIGRLGELLLGLKARLNATLLLIEHNMSLVMSISDRITVMHNGAFLAEGTAAEIDGNASVVKAYLGGGRRGRPA